MSSLSEGESLTSVSLDAVFDDLRRLHGDGMVTEWRHVGDEAVVTFHSSMDATDFVGNLLWEYGVTAAAMIVPPKQPSEREPITLRIPLKSISVKDLRFLLRRPGGHVMFQHGHPYPGAFPAHG